MKIAVFGIKNIPGRHGGYETCVDETSRRLVKKKHNVLVMCRKNFAETRMKNYEGVQIKYVPGLNSKNFSNLFSAFFSFLYLVFSDIKVLHIYITGNAIFIPFFKMIGKKIAISVDGLEWKRKKWNKFAVWYIKFSEKIAVKFADAIISDSKVINNYYFNNYNRNVDYVPYGANIMPYMGDKNIGQLGLIKSKYFFFVSMFRPEKNVDLLIKAFNLSFTMDYKLVLLGDAPDDPTYMSYIRSIASEKVILLGRVYGELYHEISQNAYCYVTASEIEGTSPALVQAMGSRVAVLVSDIAENIETIGEAGITFKTNDIIDLKNKMEYLISNPDLVSHLAEKGFERVKEKYSWDKVTDELEKIYTRLNSEGKH